MTAPPPTREEVLEGLRVLISPARSFLTALARVDADRVRAAIAHLETDPAEALAEDYAGRMEAVADLWDEEGKTTIGNHARACYNRAHGLREAARMLRDKESR